MSNYFNFFNYSLANEDTRIEAQFVDQLQPKQVAAVCGSGARAFALLNSSVQDLYLVDTSQFQLDYARFKWDLIQKLNLEDYKKIMGYTVVTAEHRKQILNATQLTEESQIFIQQFKNQHLENGFIYLGRWERFILGLSRLIRWASGTNFSPLFESRSEMEQKAVFQNIWPRKRLQFFISTLAHPRVLNIFLYKGQMVQQLNTKPFHQDLMDRFENFFETQTARQSFFMQLLFLGKMTHADGLPIEVQPEYFEKMKKFKGTLHLKHMTLNDFLKTQNNIDFVSGSDIVSYLQESQLYELGQLMLRHLSEHRCFYLFRSFKRHPALGTFLNPFKKSDLEKKCETQDASVVYQFHIYSSL